MQMILKLASLYIIIIIIKSDSDHLHRVCVDRVN